MPENMPGEGIGHFFGAMRIDAFRPAGEFKFHMDKWINRFKNSTPVAGEKRVYVPGQPEAEFEKESLKNGIELLLPVIEDLYKLGEKFGVKLE
jgi:LDH2 family malate/lactate/ureidoglycolate dehydrogenase